MVYEHEIQASMNYRKFKSDIVKNSILSILVSLIYMIDFYFLISNISHYSAETHKLWNKWGIPVCSNVPIFSNHILQVLYFYINI